MATVSAALRLHLRHRARVDARPRQKPRDDLDRVGSVGVDDDERAFAGARAHAHGVLVAEAQLALRKLLPFRGEPHALLAVDVGALEREKRDAVRAVQPLGLREHAMHFFLAPRFPPFIKKDFWPVKNVDVTREMRRSALEAVARTGEARRRVREAVANNQAATLGFAGLGALVAGGAVLLYTQEDENQQDQKCVATYHKAKAQRLDSEADTAEGQTEFDKLQADWTKAAELYLKAGNCAEAQYALGRLCSEGRGYVYDPAYGEDLYRAAAAKGNSDAKYALACAALRAALGALGKPNDVYSALYEASSLLARHASAPRAIRAYLTGLTVNDTGRALAEFNRLAENDPATWMQNTNRFLVHAAKTMDDAKAQILSALASNLFTQAHSLAYDKQWNKNGDTRAKILMQIDVFTDRHQALSVLIEKSASADEMTKQISLIIQSISALIKLGEDTDTAAHKYLVYSAVSEIIPKREPDPDVKPKITQLSQRNLKLVEEAANKRNVRAIISWLNEVGTSEKAQQRNRLLDIGASEGSLDALRYRARVHYDNNDQTAMRSDWAAAARLGCIDSLEELRQAHNKKRVHSRVKVSPLPAALQVTITEGNFAVAVRESGDEPVEKYMEAYEREPGDKSRPIKIAWPQLETSVNARAALDQLQGAYARVFDASGEAKTLIVEPMPAANFGAFSADAPVLTARALLNALAAQNISETKKVTMCVSADPLVVVDYDRAFRTCARAIPLLDPHWVYAGDFEVIRAEKALDDYNCTHCGHGGRVAIVIGYGDRLCGELSSDGWSVDTSVDLTKLADRAVKKWLTAECKQKDEINRLFRATIASASGTVKVECDQTFAHTLVFAESDHTHAETIVEKARYVLDNSKYKIVYVVIDSFLEHVEHVEESKRAQFENALRRKFSEKST